MSHSGCSNHMSVFLVMSLLILVALGGMTVLSGAIPVEVKVSGEDVSLTCRIQANKDLLLSISYVSWYRQEPDGGTNYLTAFSTYYLHYNRYSGALNLQEGIISLNISDVRRADSGMYFCIARAALNFFPGTSSKLIVTDPAVKPRVQIMSPHWEDKAPDEEDHLLLICLVTDALPLKAKLMWTVSGQELHISTLDGHEGIIAANGGYTFVSHCKIDAIQYTKDIRCSLLDSTGALIAETVYRHNQNPECLQQMVLYGLPGVFLLSLLIVVVTCIYRRRKKRARGTTTTVCYKQESARPRKCLENSTEYASLHI
ncbi:uncharacterized protein LOC114644320 [Erpetoichthys calabaricus]|uniref:uncharacterized protein LOC114644320 n=1 Tax=Erpetoichthys calabaricus TaxID=27687 RepID=UPI00109F2354|nr:uncharacterized protein LOC114644320 [Erpetoichthys calabaricus]